MSDIYLQITETPTVVTLSAPVVSGALASTVTVANTVTVALDSNSLSALENVTVTVGAAVSISNFPASQAVTFSAVTISNLPATQTIAGTVTVNTAYATSVTGTARGGVVTAMPVALVDSGVYGGSILNYNGTNTSLNITVKGIGAASLESATNFPVSGTVTVSSLPALVAGTAQIGSVTVGNSVTIGSLPAISGTVTANLGTAVVQIVNAIQDGDGTTFGIDRDFPVSGVVQIQAGSNQIGSVTASISNSVTIASLPAISGTVTANSSNGSLTTRFGSVVTANTAFETSAVTNSNRKYLLIQNVTTASNVITVGIGFTPTTTQGIQLFAGAGLTFEGSYIPTGAVNLLSSVTASCYTILEA